MDISFARLTIRRIVLILVLVCCFVTAKAQQSPLSNISYWVFDPFIYNPAIAGSKDFISAGFDAAFQSNFNTQLISANARISKTRSGYFTSPDITEFKNIGVGGTIFRDYYGISRSIGVSGTVSYQIPLSVRRLSFLAIGASVKEVQNTLDNDSTGSAHSFKKTYFPDLDLGIYYYGASFFIGLSSTNIHGNPWKSDTLDIFRIPVARQYFFAAGFKLLLNKPLNIVLEPSVLVNVNDSTIGKIPDNINPILKLYLGDFCFGSSLQSNGKISFFGQFRYPKFYVGAYYELPKNTPYFKKAPIVEFTLGLNLQPDKSRLSNHSHW